MSYYLRGNLWGYICRQCPRPLWGVVVRVYAAEGERLIERAVADPRHTTAAIDEKEVKARAGRLLAEAKVGEDGSFEIAFDEKSGYQGGPVDLDLRVKTLSHLDERATDKEPRQIHLTTLQPAWRERERDLVAFWEYYLPSTLWCLILSWFDIWAICGRVTLCETHAAIGGVVVKAFDRDWLQDDSLGQAITDSAGRFQIYYSGADFRETIFSPGINIEWTGGPDLYFRVETTNGTTLLAEPASRAREPDRENVPNCFCVELCLERGVEPHPHELPAVFTHVGWYQFDTHIDTGSGQLFNSHAFFSTLQLTGVLSKTLNGNPLQYRFEVRELADDGTPAGPWTPIARNQIAPTKIGVLEYYDPTPGIGYPFKTKDCVIHGNPASQVRVDFTDDDFIIVPQQSALYAGGAFTPNTGQLIHLISGSLADFGTLDMADVMAGEPSTAHGAALGHNRHFGLRMMVREQADEGTPAAAGSDAGTLPHIAINNTTYPNIVQHPYWGADPQPPHTLAVSMLGIEQLQGNGCRKIEDKLTILVTAAHPMLDSVTLTITGGNVAIVAPGSNPAVITAPAAGLPDQRFGPATLNFDPKDLKTCAYIVKLASTIRLTDGASGGPGVFRDEIAFAKS